MEKVELIANVLPQATETEIAGLLQAIALKSVHHGIVITEANGPDNAIVYANEAFAQMTGRSTQDLLGLDCRFLQGTETDPAERARLGQAIAAREPCVAILKNYRQNGESFWNKISVTPVHGDSGQARYFVGVQEDITEQRQIANRERQLGEILEESLNEIYIFAADDLQFLRVNHGARSNLGYTKAELAQLTPVDIKPEFEHAQFVQMLDPLITGEQEKLDFNTIHQRKDGTTYPVEVHLQRAVFDSTPAYVAIILDITQRKQSEAQLRESYDDLRSMSMKLQTIRDEERRRLARELHDEVSQLLAAAQMDLSMLEGALPDCSDEVTELLASLKNITERSVMSLRTMVHDLRPNVLEEAGLFGGIEMLADEIGRRHDFRVAFNVSGEITSLPDSLVTPVYRLIQESLNNVGKHAQASEVSISLTKTDQELTVRVRDNGVGLSTKKPSKRSGFGLTGMRERVDILGGQFTISASSGQGTEVVAILPVVRS